MGNFVEESINGVKDFAKESVQFVQKCSKPDKKEFIKIATSCAIGFAVMGIIGYLIKLLFIPINSILLSH
jgi:protein transport protein SEC61 subunit gamma-like protein